jgi:hypothetical protein
LHSILPLLFPATTFAQSQCGKADFAHQRMIFRNAMNRTARTACRIAILLSIFGAIIGPQARPVEGVVRLKLTTPVTKEISAQAQRFALDSLRVDMWSWINENYDMSWDTTSLITNYHLANLLSFIAPKTKSESRFEGKEWIYILRITEDSLAAAIAAYNGRIDSAASRFWDLAAGARNRNEKQGSFIAAVAAIFYAMGHIGTPVPSPVAGSTGTFLDEARQNLQNIFSRMSITVSDMVITGKPGIPAKDAPFLLAKIDSVPFSGLPLRATLAGGRELFITQTDLSGRASLNNMVIPYVTQGTFITVTPHLGRIIHVPIVFGVKDLGMSTTQSQEQVLILKVIPAFYVLKYNATAVSQVPIPADFAGPGIINHYLQDSCQLRQQAGSSVANLVFDVACQISSYRSDATESITLKCEAKIDILQLKTGVHSQRQETLHEMAVGQDKNLPLGLFYWQCAANLRRMLKQMLAEL